ncbi:unnamed protein product [Paramecium sonneborni]|uniref:ADP,ATP carrier protein n=1 Tax=Paramecium sonneborni TaxID=65129 RepID=A0A8S1PPR1_9CILI|nr:unnamed protein product [Paramecium sonneborni]
MEEYVQGFVSTSIVKTVLAPLERYKLIRQTQDILTLSSKEKMTNFYQFVKKTISNEGVKGLFRSNLTAIYMWIPQVYAQHVFYQNIKQATYDKDILSMGLCATLCGITTSIFSYPLDTIRVRQATEIQIPGQKRMYIGFEETRFNIKLENGFFKGLYSGFTVGCIQTLLFAYGIVGLNQLLEGMTPYNQQLAYLGSYALIYPIDSVRRRLQVKSILFQQEASKKQNLWEKLKFNMKEWNFSWGYGGFLAHNIRGIAMLIILEQVNFESLYKQTQNQLNQVLKY